MQKAVILSEIVYKAIRSSGAGGQHVNKVSSKVVLSFDLLNSQGLTDVEKALIEENLGSRLNKEGVLQLSCDTSSSQFRNKALVTERLLNLLAESSIKPTIRRATKPTRGSVLRKIKNKKKQSEKKNRRQKPRED